jgi:5-methylcytosine-specific restriction protein B
MILRDGSPLVDALELLRVKRNLVLQGPPWAGKTFVANRLAFLLMGRRDTDASRRCNSTERQSEGPHGSRSNFIAGSRRHSAPGPRCPTGQSPPTGHFIRRGAGGQLP